MNREKLLELMKEAINYVMPEISVDDITYNDSLKDLGANSVDRTEILIILMEDANVRLPMVSFGNAKNIGDIIDIVLQAL
ncbi:MAG: phosphopantetheine-binding protein [Acutalibacteraceae bacterium]|nr:phosphopantetheine-binding protein [Acutalibacteraceae bacterium]